MIHVLVFQGPYCNQLTHNNLIQCVLAIEHSSCGDNEDIFLSCTRMFNIIN